MKADVESSKAHDIRIIPIILNNAKLHKKRTGQVYKGFQQGTVIQSSVGNSRYFVERFSNA